MPCISMCAGPIMRKRFVLMTWPAPWRPSARAVGRCHSASAPARGSSPIWADGSPSSALPDFASVNLSEEGAIEVCRALIEKGVGVEAGIGAEGEVGLLAASGLAPRCLRILIEPVEPDAADALATVRAVNAALDTAGIALPRLTHGFEATTWPVFGLALELGHDSRIGLEDSCHLPDGSAATDNAALVEAARARERSGATRPLAQL